MAKNKELTAKFIRERNVFENNDGSRVIIGDAWHDGRDITIKGDAFEGQLRPGLCYRFYGQWRNHERFGKQFWFQNFVMETPADEGAVRAYLKQCKGIGPAVSGQLWKTYGDKAIKVLREKPEQAAADIARLKLEDALEASEFLKRNHRIERAKVDLMSVLNGKGFSRKLPDKIIRDFGSTSADVVKKNPYILMRYKGVGFQKADRLYLDLGHPPAKLKRQTLCAVHAIQTQHGDTWHPIAVARNAIAQNVASSRINHERALQLARRGHLLEQRYHCNTWWLAETRKAMSEKNVADAAISMTSDEAFWPEAVEGLSEHQIENLQKATRRQLGILAGSPGTGKTYTAAALIRSLIGEFGLSKIAVAAPTGKAAVRISQALTDNGLPMTAKTIHSLLGVMSSDDGYGFEYGQFNPLPYKFILVDEASMIDCDLMSSLLLACDSSTHVLLIGDTNQLSPVGHGAPLRDLINAGIPCGELTEIRRNSGRIVRTCAEIREANRFTASEKLDLENGENLLHLEKPTPESQIEQLEGLLSRLQGDPERKYDPIWDIQVLVAVNKKSELGRKALNEKLQKLLNPRGRTVAGGPFRVGDKIINTKNEKFRDLNGEGEHYVANGEQAEVVEVEKTRVIARLIAPPRLIVIPKGDTSKQDPDREKQTGDDDKDEPTGTGCNWELGYAISVHKSQGSEWPIAIVMLDSNPAASRVQSRNWIYTAISRAKTFCITIGQRKIANEMTRRDGLRRKTFLVETIQQLRGPADEPEEKTKPAETPATVADVAAETAAGVNLGFLLEGVM
ncbi:AAA family ATPase [bacterium]|nr:AAA family ATPase [bacterium]